MDDLLAHERATEDAVQKLLKNPDEPIKSLISAFDEYRSAC